MQSYVPLPRSPTRVICSDGYKVSKLRSSVMRGWFLHECKIHSMTHLEAIEYTHICAVYPFCAFHTPPDLYLNFLIRANKMIYKFTYIMLEKHISYSPRYVDCSGEKTETGNPF